MPKRVHHVQFCEEGEKKKPLSIETVASHCVKIHVGILKVYSKYRVEVQIPKAIANLSTMKNVVNSESNCKLESLTEEPLGNLITVELSVCQYPEIEEELIFQEKDSYMHIIFSASVLSPNSGTPLLKDGVHFLGKIATDDSEASDEF